MTSNQASEITSREQIETIAAFNSREQADGGRFKGSRVTCMSEIRKEGEDKRWTHVDSRAGHKQNTETARTVYFLQNNA